MGGHRAGALFDQDAARATALAASPPRQRLEGIPGAFGQRTLLLRTPTFHLRLPPDRIGDRWEGFRVDQFHRAASPCVGWAMSGIVQIQACFEISGVTNIVGVVGAAEDVDERRHRMVPLDSPCGLARDTTRLGPRGLAHGRSGSLALAWPATSEAPQGPSRVVEAPGVAPGSENTSPQESTMRIRL